MRKWFGFLLFLGIPTVSLCRCPPIDYPSGLRNADLGFHNHLNSPAVYPESFKFLESDESIEIRRQMNESYEPWAYGFDREVYDCPSAVEEPQNLIVGTRLSVLWNFNADEEPYYWDGSEHIPMSRVCYSTYIAQTVKNPKTGKLKSGYPMNEEILNIWYTIAEVGILHISRYANAKSERDPGRSVIASDLHRVHATKYNYAYVDCCDVDTDVLLELLKKFR